MSVICDAIFRTALQASILNTNVGFDYVFFLPGSFCIIFALFVSKQNCKLQNANLQKATYGRSTKQMWKQMHISRHSPMAKQQVLPLEICYQFIGYKKVGDYCHRNRKLHSNLAGWELVEWRNIFSHLCYWEHSNKNAVSAERKSIQIGGIYLKQSEIDYLFLHWLSPLKSVAVFFFFFFLMC